MHNGRDPDFLKNRAGLLTKYSYGLQDIMALYRLGGFLLLYYLTAWEGCEAALYQSLPWGIWPCWARTIYARYKEIPQPIQQTQARKRLVPVDSSLCVPLAASWREVPVLIRLHIEASDVPKWVKCKCLNQAQIVHGYDSAGPVISSASAQLDCQNTRT